MTSTPLLGRHPLNVEAESDGIHIWIALLLFAVFYYALGNEWETPLKGLQGFHADAVDVEIVAESGKMLWRVAFLGIGFTGAVLLVIPSYNRFAIRGFLGLLIVLTYGYAWSSLLWSEFPSVTVRRLVVLSLTCLGAFGFAKHCTNRHITLLAVVHCLTVLVVSVAAELAHGTLAITDPTYRFAGTLHPNQQAIKMATLCLAALALLPYYPRWRVAIGCLAFAAVAALFFTKSRSSLAALAFALFGVWLVATNLHTKLIVAVVVTALGFLLVGAAVSVGIDNTEALSEVISLGRDDDGDPSSLTGRLEIWEYVVDDLEDRFWLGFGYNTYWNEDRLTEAHRVLEWALPDAHNAYIDTMAGIGFLGLLAVLGIVIMGTFSVGIRNGNDPAKTFLLGFCLFGFLNGMVESHMLQPFSFSPFLLATAYFRYAFFVDVTTPSG